MRIVVSTRRRDRAGATGAIFVRAFVVAASLALAAPVAASGQDAPGGSSRPARVIPESLRFAHGLFRQRKFDLAAEAYQQFLDDAPDAAPVDADDARFGLASARLLQGRYKESRAAFQEFLRLSPKHARARTAWYRLGELSYMLGDLPAAREALERFTADAAPHPNLEAAWTYLGDVRSALDDPEAAKQAYETSLTLAPDARLSDRARYGLGRALASLGETQKALDVLREVVRRGASDWVDKALLQIGKIEAASGRFADAEKTFEKLAGLVPPSAYRLEAQLRRGEALARLDRRDEALALLRPLAADPSQPSSLDAALTVGAVELRQGRADEALKTLDEALAHASKSPLEPALLYRSAEALRALKRSDDARARFLKVAEVSPADPWADDAWLQAARLALDAGDFAEAGRLAASFPERFPKSSLGPELILIRARAALDSEKPADAVALLEPLVGPGAPALAPEQSDAARYDLARAYRATGKGEKADELLASLPKSAEAAFLLGQSRLEAGRFADAVSEFDRYLKDAPDGQVADHALAHLTASYLGLGKRDEAGKALERLAERFPDSPALAPARLRFAESALEAGDLPKAIEQFSLVASPPPGSKAAVPQTVRDRAETGLARALARKGDAAGAASALDAIAGRAGDASQTASLALEIARSLEDAGKTEEALTAYEKVQSRFAADDSALRAGLARARLLAELKRPGDAAGLIGGMLDDAGVRKRLEAIGQPIDALKAERAWDLADAGETAEADAAFADLLRTFPDSEYAADARFNLAEAANEKKDFAEVVRLLSPLAKPEKPDAPKPPDRLLPAVLYRLGRTQVELGDWAAAVSTLDRLIADFAADRRVREARLLRAEASLRQDRFEAAEADLSALAAGPSSPDDPPNFARVVRDRRLQALLGLKRWKEALAEADALKPEAAGGGPGPAAVVDFARGRALLGLGRPEDARSAFQDVIKARPGSELAAQAQLMRGEAYFLEDRFREARMEFLRVDINYNAPRWQAAALLETGKVDERLGQWREAVATYDDLISRFGQDPSASEARNRRAAVLDQHKANGPGAVEAK